jgi:DNA-binding SARP family transcriptional activator
LSTLSIRLFGELSIRREGDIENQPLGTLEAGKAQELLCYVLLHRSRALPREVLAEELWGGNSAGQSRKYLRKALWQLQTALESLARPGDVPLLLVDADRIRLNPDADLRADVADFASAYWRVHGAVGERLSHQQASAARAGVDLYRGDLLEGWYQDWCLYERERFRDMYLAMLDKLMAYCEMNDAYDEGVGYGTLILSHDRARERTHQRLMRLHYLLGDRAAALQQYARCVAALERDLGVGPSRRTRDLHQQIRSDQLADEPGGESGPPANNASLPSVLGRLRQLRNSLVLLERQVDGEILAVESTLSGKDSLAS